MSTLTSSNVTPSTAASNASDLLEGATSVSDMVYGLPNSDFIVTYAATSNGGSRVILKSVDDPDAGVISLYNNIDPEALKELLPEDLYDAGSVELYFQPSASAGSETVYNFQLFPTAIAKKLLARKSQVAQPMVFPSKKAQINGDEANFATAINRGNKGVAAVHAAKAFKGESAVSGFFKSLLS